MKKNIEINVPEGWDIDLEKLENCITSNNTNLLIPLKKIEVKPEYPKIISFREVRYNNLFVLTDIEYKDCACNVYYSLNSMLCGSSSLEDGFIEIYQVAQSENEIFTLGDNVKNVDNKFFTIKQFVIDDKYGIIAKDDKNFEYVEYLKRIVLPIFTTEDGFDIYDKDQYVYGVCTKANWQIRECKVSSILRSRGQEFSSSYNSDSWKFFSTVEARDDYRDDNISKFSKKQINDAIDDYNKHTIFISKRAFKEILGI